MLVLLWSIDSSIFRDLSTNCTDHSQRRGFQLYRCEKSHCDERNDLQPCDPVAKQGSSRSRCCQIGKNANKKICQKLSVRRSFCFGAHFAERVWSTHRLQW